MDFIFQMQQYLHSLILLLIILLRFYYEPRLDTIEAHIKFLNKTLNKQLIQQKLMIYRLLYF